MVNVYRFPKKKKKIKQKRKQAKMPRRQIRRNEIVLWDEMNLQDTLMRLIFEKKENCAEKSHGLLH
jgi:hypothetical protein